MTPDSGAAKPTRPRMRISPVVFVRKERVASCGTTYYPHTAHTRGDKPNRAARMDSRNGENLLQTRNASYKPIPHARGDKPKSVVIPLRDDSPFPHARG